ncbi:SusC/RagA family TonB-linked outer membrane protein [Dysgonomonas sp. Marseille-P4677]|uniref:SusC/RagA family TonB-linked outer membrane protein n=1 Tax=Dysgonomonas sp. Marseille-P4677 TaxID=2364790 RepID=UPI0019112E09|nr:SusC/RagA family TonB-linked outer membrane protein [Dysgonomonas sp. Marseille-P4677]MBK5721704.1 SusC/RagA family TonB-linked outer membrane protein [Dysgonomonas sp. Marseille-P4677]
MKKKPILTFFCFVISVLFAFGQTKNVQGIVMDDTGEPLIGAIVSIKGTTVGTTTDVDGKFSLSIPSDATELTFSYIGFKEMVLPVQLQMKVQLSTDSQQLKEVVVTGMTKIDRRLFTGAADQLKAENVLLDGVAEISRGLEGRSAGVSVQNVSGTFGAAPKIRVRGATSIYGSSKPLWVVDGVIMEDVIEVDADNLSSGDAETLISSAIAGISADDIESFQILKDGSATSIYGAKAMSGVIVVTTKKGKAGVSRINYTGEFTTRMKPYYKEFNIMDSQEQMGIYREMEQKGWLNFAETFRKASSGVYGNMYRLIDQYDPISGQFGLANNEVSRNRYLQNAEMRNTNWFNELFSTNIVQNHSVSLSTGTERATFYGSMSAMVDPGWYKQSDVQRFTGSLNASFKVLNNLTLNMITTGSYRKQRAPGTLSQTLDVVSGEVKRDFDINPYSFAINSSRALNPYTYYTKNYAPFNIFNELDNNYMEFGVTDLKFQADLTWKIVPEFELNLLGALKYSTTSQEHNIKDASNQALAYRAMDDATIAEDNPFLYTDPEVDFALPISVLPYGGFHNTTNRKMLGYDFRLSGTWNKLFDQTHATNFYGGMELNSVQRNMSEYMGVGTQYDSGMIPFYSYWFFKQGLEENSNYYDLARTDGRTAAFFAMGSYSYLGRYALSTTVRYEGSNRVGAKNRSSARWLPTWNVSGKWTLTEESFFEKVTPILSHAALRLSYSLTGDVGIQSISNSSVIIKNYNPWRPLANMKETGISIADIANADLTYEKKHEFNIGAELGFIDNRLNLTMDWFKRTNYDLLGMIPTTGVTGDITPYANAAEMKSDGFEFSISSRNIVSKDFSWNTDFIFGYVDTEITDLMATPRIIDLVSGMGAPRQGFPHRGLFSIRFDGLNEEGIPTFIGPDGNNTISGINLQLRDENNGNLDFLKYEGSTAPTVTGSLGNVFRYKNFRLNAFLTYSLGNVIRLDPAFKNEYSDLDAMPREFKNRWVMPGDENVTNVPVIVSARQDHDITGLKKAYNAYNYSTERIAKGDFIRLKEVSLTYDIPKTILPKEINALSLKLQATNLFLLYSDSKLNGQDPEFFRSGGVSAPVPRQFTFTLRLGL